MHVCITQECSAEAMLQNVEVSADDMARAVTTLTDSETGGLDRFKPSNYALLAEELRSGADPLYEGPAQCPTYCPFLR